MREMERREIEAESLAAGPMAALPGAFGGGAHGVAATACGKSGGPVERTGGSDRLLSAELLAVLGASSSFGFALATFYLLPKFLVERLVATPSQVGLVMGAFGVATVAGAFLVAHGVDSYARKDLIGVAALVTAIASLGYLLVGAVGPLLLVLRSVQGLCFAFVLTAVGALVVEIVPPARLSQAFGLSGASMLVMSAVAPPIVEPLAATYGWSSVFVVAGCTAALGALLSRAVAEPRIATPAVVHADMRREVLRRRATREYALVTAAIGSAFGVMFTFEPPFLLELGFANVGGFFIAYSISAIGVRALFGSVPDRFGRLRIATWSLGLYAAAVLAMSVVRPAGIPVVGAMLGIAHGMFFPAFNALVLGRVPGYERGTLLAVFTGAFYGGMALGVWVFGAIAELVGYRVVFGASSVIVAAAGVLLLTSAALREHGPPS